MAERGSEGSNGLQDFDILVDGAVVGTIKPYDALYRRYRTASFLASAGTHTFSFRGRDDAGRDHTSFIDDVRIYKN